jgi:hypothetical protein
MDTPDNSKNKPSSGVGQLTIQRRLQDLRDNQDLAAAALGGALAAAAGALAWAALSYYTEYQLGIMALGIGFLVGYAVRKFGKGVDAGFGILGAIYSLVGCVVGNLLTVCAYIAREEGREVMDVIAVLDLDGIVEIMLETTTAYDLLFYGLAVHFGYKYSIYRVTEKDLRDTARPTGGMTA